MSCTYYMNACLRFSFSTSNTEVQFSCYPQRESWLIFLSLLANFNICSLEVWRWIQFPSLPYLATLCPWHNPTVSSPSDQLKGVGLGSVSMPCLASQARWTKRLQKMWTFNQKYSFPHYQSGAHWLTKASWAAVGRGLHSEACHQSHQTLSFTEWLLHSEASTWYNGQCLHPWSGLARCQQLKRVRWPMAILSLPSRVGQPSIYDLPALLRCPTPRVTVRKTLKVEIAPKENSMLRT